MTAPNKTEPEAEIQQPTPTLPEKAEVLQFTEAPISCNVKFVYEGYDWMVTLRGTDPADLDTATLDRIVDVSNYLLAIGAESTRPQPSPAPVAPAPVTNAPVLTPAAAAPVVAGAPPQPVYVPVEQAPQPEEAIAVSSITHAITDNGNHFILVKGGKYSKYGLKAWEEVVPAPGWQDWQIGMAYAPPPGMTTAFTTDGKKISRFA